MNIHRLIVWITVIAALIIAVLLWHEKKRTTEPPFTNALATNAISPANTPAMSRSVNAALQTNATVRKSDMPAAAQLSQVERAVGILSTYNDVPIDFYGIVEDQLGDVVPGVTIDFSIRVMNGHESTVKRGEVVSDSNGAFAITGYHGQDLGFMPKKAGYALATIGTLFKYSHMEEHPFISDRNNPTVIKMWKLQGAKPLVGINKSFKLPYTAAPIYIDLLAGQIVPSGGDIKLTVIRSPGVISGRNRLDWSVQVEAVDGGVMDSGGQEKVTYAAPEEGYQPSMIFMFSTNAPYKWAGGFNQGFFVMSRNGLVYSKLGLGFGINSAPDDFMNITFSGVASTNGSRNWEATAPQ